MKHASVVLLSAVLLLACDNRPEEWNAFVYPGDDLIEYEEIRGFRTFELCRSAAIERLRALRPDGGGSYECGYKCEPLGSYGDMNLCEETRD